MAGKKKFGAFAGVFTPSLLTILGVIMYLRMGWVVGNAGLIGTLAIILLAHVISISTGLSISSIATDKKVGAGGIYYILSRSLGIPIGGAIGLTLYIGTAFSIALYLIGFAESFNVYMGFADTVNGLRITGTIALLALTAIALISTSVAIKTQFFILAAIVISLVSVFFGMSTSIPEHITTFATEGSVPLELVFAIFFPAVTGFTAGIAMSGDLRNPKKDIPIGTISAIAVGFIVYVGLAIFLAMRVDPETLKSDYNILLKIALFAPVVVAGIWGATLSSALGGILGGPRILQAMSIDRITPRLFGKGRGKNNEPVNALLLVFVIALSGILIGELDVIARVVSMFYLAAYGIINLSFFLESWANPDFQPSFKVKRWIGLLGFVASFAVMFKLDTVAMFGAIIIITAIYFRLKRKQIALETGDVWQSVWQNIVAKGLKKLYAKEASANNWNPNVILFSSDSAHRSYLVELSRAISGRTGIVTNFKLILEKDNNKTLSKASQVVKDEEFEKLGVFARQVKVDNIFQGIENIASTFGFSGVEPNTIMMGWPRLLNNSADYSKMTEKLLHLDYNLLYLDFDRKKKFGDYKTVDLWWRETDSKNVEMMLNIARFVLQSAQWNEASIRVLFVNNNNVDTQIIRSKITKLVNDLRVNVEIKIINNEVEQKAFYDIIALQSAQTDLTLIGIPNFETEKQAQFIVSTSHLFETIGSTLMVKASNNFNELTLDLPDETVATETKVMELQALPETEEQELREKVHALDGVLRDSLVAFQQPALVNITTYYAQFIDDLGSEFDRLTKKLSAAEDRKEAIQQLQFYTLIHADLSVKLKENKLDALAEVLGKGITDLLITRENFLKNAAATLKLSNSKHLQWKRLLKYYFAVKIAPVLQASLNDFSTKNFILLNTLTAGFSKQSYLFIDNLAAGNVDALEVFKKNFKQLLADQKEYLLQMRVNLLMNIQFAERGICAAILTDYAKPEFTKQLRKAYKELPKKTLVATHRNIADYANNWQRIQQLSHRQTEIGMELLHACLGLSAINDSINLQLKEFFIQPQLSQLELLSKTLDVISKKRSRPEAATINAINELAEGISHVNFSNLFDEEEKRILAISSKATKSVELMSSDAINDLMMQQGDEIETITVNIQQLQNKVIQSDYLAPLQDVLEKLEDAYSHNSEALYNAANHLTQLLDELLKDPENSDNKILILKEQEDIAQLGEVLNKLAESLSIDLSVNLQQTQNKLDIRTIIDSFDSGVEANKKTVIKSRLSAWINTQLNLFETKRKKLVHFVLKSKQEVATLKFNELHQSYFNRIEQTTAFISRLNVDSLVAKQVPFYYKKLFTGSYLSGANTAQNPEMERALTTIEQIKSGTSGALMIVGDSLSGKTHLSERIVRSLSEFERFDIQPPEKQNYTASDLDIAFQKIFTKKGTSLSIVNQLKKSRVFVFNDLESWWTRAENGNECLNELADLIEKTGDKHFFIINCNKYSYQLIKETTQLQKVLLATIVMRPASRTELKEIILNRHKIGSAEVYYKNDLVENSGKINALINEIHRQSFGNVGVALQLWLSSIKLLNDQLHIIKPVTIPFPPIEHPEWKLLLYHFILSRKLSEKHLKKILGKDSTWIKVRLAEMGKSGLIFKQPDGNYQLHLVARIYIEKWLKTLSFFKA